MNHIRTPIDRLPRGRIERRGFYANIDPAKPRDPADNPNIRSPVIIIFDGGNGDEVAGLAGACRGQRYKIIVTSHLSIDHITDLVCGLDIDSAYLWDGEFYRPTDVLLDAIREHIIDGDRHGFVTCD